MSTASEEQKDATYLGRFFMSALAHNSMITNKIYTSGNKLAGISVDYDKKGFKGIKDFKMLVDASAEEGKNE